MNEYISREAMLENLNADLEHHSDEGDPLTVLIMRRFVKYVKDFPSEDVISSAKVKDLQSQIADLKRCIKSLNSDYLTGYISALSAVERMIIKMLGE